MVGTQNTVEKVCVVVVCVLGFPASWVGSISPVNGAGGKKSEAQVAGRSRSRPSAFPCRFRALPPPRTSLQSSPGRRPGRRARRELGARSAQDRASGFFSFASALSRLGFSPPPVSPPPRAELATAVSSRPLLREAETKPTEKPSQKRAEN